MCVIAIKYIRKSLEEGNLFYTKHATCRMNERMIDAEDVEECIRKGKMVEKQDFPEKDRRIIFYGGNKERIYAVVTAAMPCLVITVCKVEDDIWECTDSGSIRRK